MSKVPEKVRFVVGADHTNLGPSIGPTPGSTMTGNSTNATLRNQLAEVIADTVLTSGAILCSLIPRYVAHLYTIESEFSESAKTMPKRSNAKPTFKPYLKSIVIEKPQGSQNFPFNIPALSNLETMDFHRDVTFFIGENGSGKSTLLEGIAIAMGFAGQGGTQNVDVEDRYGASSISNYIRVRKGFNPKDRFFLRAETLYNFGDYLEDLVRNPDARTTSAQVFARYGGKSLHAQSHGESFMSIFVNALGGHGLYLFDEPEAALSPARQLAALVRIEDLVNQQSQFIIATHSPILLSYPRAKIYLFDQDGCREIAYQDTEHYSITKDFLNNYEHRLARLLE